MGLVYFLNNPNNLAKAIVNLTIASIFVLLSVPFAITFPLSHYEQIDGIPVGTRWYIGLLFLIFTFLFTLIGKYYKTKNLKLSLQNNLFSLFFLTISATIINSLWIHGVFIYFDYFLSFKLFLTSEMCVSLIIGMGATLAIDVFQQ